MELLIGLAVIAVLFYLVNKAVVKKADNAEAAPYKVEAPVAPATTEVSKKDVAVKLRKPGTPKKAPATKKPATKASATKAPAKPRAPRKPKAQ